MRALGRRAWCTRSVDSTVGEAPIAFDQRPFRPGKERTRAAAALSIRPAPGHLVARLRAL
jgi:hypothetical protein